MRDKSGWGQVLIGVISIVLGIGVGWVAISTDQAEAQVKIVQLEEKIAKSTDYDAYLQEQVDRNENRLIIAETTLKFLRENSEETNNNIKILVSEVQKLNITLAAQQAQLEK